MYTRLHEVNGIVGEDVKFERIRRVTGYLVGTLDRFNDAKRAEVAERIHLLAHLAGYAEEARRAAVEPVRDECEQDEDRAPDEIATVRGKNRTHAEDKVR